jgi:hypothetical protein
MTDLKVVAGAAVAAVVAWLCAAQLAGIDLTVSLSGDEQHVGGVAVAVSTVVVGLIGIVALRVLERLTSAALKVWTVVALAVALVSLLGPLSATSPAAKGTLIGLHAVVSVIVIVTARHSRRGLGLR